MIPTMETTAGWVALAAASFSFIVSVICAIAWIRGPHGEWADNTGRAMGTVFGGILTIAAATPPLVGFGLVGYSPDYLYYHPVSGNVEQVASRQIASGHAMSTRFVVTLEGQPYAIDDTRAALLKPGDHVSLMCTKEFQWGSTNNGYACNWGE